MDKSKNLDTVLKGTTAYYEALVPEVRERLESDKLVFLNYSLPIGCQYNCLKCFVGGSKAYSEQLKKRGIALKNFDDFTSKKMIQEAYALGVRTVVVAGAGEPLLSPKLDLLVQTCSGLKGMHLIVFTNGLLLDRKKAEEFFSKGVSIVFSLDSLSEKNYDRLTGTKGNFEKVLGHFRQALELSEKYSRIQEGFKVVPLAVNTNPSLLVFNPKENINELEKISKLINGRATHFVSHITPNSNAVKNWVEMVGTSDFSPNPMLKETEKIYSSGLGGSSRKKNGKCAYLNNGVSAFEGHWMICPNFGQELDLGCYPEKGINQHFEEKKEILEKKGFPSCITRKE